MTHGVKLIGKTIHQTGEIKKVDKQSLMMLNMEMKKSKLKRTKKAIAGVIMKGLAILEPLITILKPKQTTMQKITMRMMKIYGTQSQYLQVKEEVVV